MFEWAIFAPAVLIQAAPWADEQPWKPALVGTVGVSWQAGAIHRDHTTISPSRLQQTGSWMLRHRRPPPHNQPRRGALPYAIDLLPTLLVQALWYCLALWHLTFQQQWQLGALACMALSLAASCGAAQATPAPRWLQRPALPVRSPTGCGAAQPPTCCQATESTRLVADQPAAASARLQALLGGWKEPPMSQLAHWLVELPTSVTAGTLSGRLVLQVRRVQARLHAGAAAAALLMRACARHKLRLWSQHQHRLALCRCWRSQKPMASMRRACRCCRSA